MENITVEDREGEQRFVLEVEGREAELLYRVVDGELRLVHTEVPEELGGRGLGGHLVRAAIERGRADGLVLVPWCPFTRGWLERHPEAHEGLEIDWASEPPEE